MRLTDEGGERRRRASQGFKTAPSSVWPAASHLPPCGGKAWGRSNREEFGLLWDVWIHILGIGAKCACWKAGGPVCRPYGGNVVSPGGAPCRVVCGRRAGEDTRPYGDCGRKTVGAQCAPLHGEEREPAPSSAPSVCTGAPSPQGEGYYRRVRIPAPTGLWAKNGGRTMCAPTPRLRTALYTRRGTGLGPVP